LLRHRLRSSAGQDKCKDNAEVKFDPVVVYCSIGALFGALFGWFGMSIVRRVSNGETDSSLLRNVRWLGAVAMLLLWGMFPLARFIEANAWQDMTPQERTAYGLFPAAFLVVAAFTSLVSLLIENSIRKRQRKAFKEGQLVAEVERANRSEDAQLVVSIPPLPATFYAKPAPVLGFLVSALLLIGVGISDWSTRNGRAVGEVVAGVAMLIRGVIIRISPRRSLRLDSESFALSQARRSRTYAFSEVDHFMIHTGGMKKSVGWEYRPDSASKPAKFARKLTGADGILGADFGGMTTSELCDLLNRMLAVSKEKSERRQTFF
jgi:uncharacterized protein YkuJ